MKKILIVDDDRDFRAIVSNVLGDEGFSILEATDGLEAIALLQGELPDAVLLDQHMPNISGIATLMELKRLNPQIPVIMISATQDSGVPNIVSEFVACQFIAKPPDFGELVSIVKRIVDYN